MLFFFHVFFLCYKNNHLFLFTQFFGQSQTIPKVAGVILKLAGTIPKLAGTIPKVAGVILKLAGTIPKVAGVILKLAGVILKLTGVILKLAGTIPKVAEGLFNKLCQKEYLIGDENHIDIIEKRKLYITTHHFLPFSILTKTPTHKEVVNLIKK